MGARFFRTLARSYNQLSKVIEWIKQLDDSNFPKIGGGSAMIVAMLSYAGAIYSELTIQELESDGYAYSKDNNQELYLVKNYYLFHETQDLLDVEDRALFAINFLTYPTVTPCDRLGVMPMNIRVMFAGISHIVRS